MRKDAHGKMLGSQVAIIHAPAMLCLEEREWNIYENALSRLHIMFVKEKQAKNQESSLQRGHVGFAFACVFRTRRPVWGCWMWTHPVVHGPDFPVSLHLKTSYWSPHEGSREWTCSSRVGGAAWSIPLRHEKFLCNVTQPLKKKACPFCVLFHEVPAV